MNRYSERKIVELFANSGDPDQTPRSATSDLGLHCLQITLLGVSSLQWVKPGTTFSTILHVRPAKTLSLHWPHEDGLIP